ncbi:flagellar hook-basal body complex protein [Sulfitobacter sabulilitoris]|uniref:Flagellar basal-body rod protein FlgF n=1 Tax=Sulfitobacter sabulilitoris TaxID=2562655 RepID=A0A5S3PEQ6_9RHOB|nr:flagellar hook-basal body complex protein [Sulfitobacter sabulilitoris]TMM52507.1 flagellar hook-basal body complex protein [Sulfitobacter sabulilitoris]
MENAGYTTLTRQSGLMREMRVVANNIANAATTGYRQEGVIFSEYVQRIEGGASLSMGQGNVRNTAFDQGALTQTGGTFDFAIEGDAFFLVETPGGPRLTRAGAFSPSANGDLVTYDGYRVLDAGGAPVFVPPGATDLSVSSDGTISSGGTPLGQLGLVEPIIPGDLVREDGVMFRSDAGYEPSEIARVLQGSVENSNVNAIGQIARMIEVQRAYEMGQSFLETEDERVRQALKALSQ